MKVADVSLLCPELLRVCRETNFDLTHKCVITKSHTLHNIVYVQIKTPNFDHHKTNLNMATTSITYNSHEVLASSRIRSKTAFKAESEQIRGGGYPFPASMPLKFYTYMLGRLTEFKRINRYGFIVHNILMMLYLSYLSDSSGMTIWGVCKCFGIENTATQYVKNHVSLLVRDGWLLRISYKSTYKYIPSEKFLREYGYNG